MEQRTGQADWFHAGTTGIALPKRGGVASDVTPELWTAASRGRKEEMLKLLAEGVDIDGRKGLDDSSPLLAASTSGHVECCRLLLQDGADVSAEANDGTTALHRASAGGHDAVVWLLIQRVIFEGGDVSAQV